MMSQGDRDGPIVFLTYYPPLLGTQRVGRFINELRRLGHDARVVCSDHEWTGPAPDHIRLVRDPLFSPQARHLSLLRAQLHPSAQGLAQIARKLRRYVHAMVAIPDMHHWWAQRAAAVVRSWMAGQPFTLITSGPPFSVIPAGLRLKLQTGCRWLCDYRDGWTFEPLDKNLLQFSWRRAVDAHLELRCLRSSDAVLAATHGIAADLVTRGLPAEAVHVMYNAFEYIDGISTPQPPGPRHIVHTGRLSLSRPGTSAESFWKALALLKQARGAALAEQLHIDMYGDYTEGEQREPHAHGVGELVSFPGRIDAAAARKVQQQAHALLLVLKPASPHVLTGKVFEYLPTHRPILAIGDPQGELADILRDTGTGVIYRHDQSGEIAAALDRWLFGQQPLCTAQRRHDKIAGHCITRRAEQLLHLIGAPAPAVLRAA